MASRLGVLFDLLAGVAKGLGLLGHIEEGGTEVGRMKDPFHVGFPTETPSFHLRSLLRVQGVWGWEYSILFLKVPILFKAENYAPKLCSNCDGPYNGTPQACSLQHRTETLETNFFRKTDKSGSLEP